MTRAIWATKHAVKTVLNDTVQATGLYKPLGRLRGGLASVFFYRAVGEVDSVPICSDNIIPTEAFRRQMDYLAEHRNVVSLVDCLEAIDSTGASGLYSVPAAGGTPREVVRFDDPSKSVLPQSLVVKDKVYFALAEYESDIWVMDLEW